ncbi:DUF5654 family protein [Patescibacteria group bacterium]|nr:DUF5654 family protein [Patescibacteria group bacterium]MCL5010030.1 DUF5654 family protein [Patescibacteria group bacterium]
MKAKKKQEKKLPIEVVRQMLVLSTSGFGLVAALAWNNVIQELVNDYIKKLLPKGGSAMSLLVYAVAVTALAVFVTWELSKIIERLEK